MCFCFPGSATVETVNGKQPIGELHQSNCHLITSNPDNIQNTKKDTFLTFIHFDPHTKTTFLVLTCQNGEKLVISGEHLLFVVKSNAPPVAIPAKRVEIGDSLIHFDQNRNPTLTPVVQIQEVEELGVFSPLSKSGTLLVDGFLVSCYAHLGNLNQATAHASFGPLRLWYKSKKGLSAESKTPKIKSNPQVGIHNYAKGLMSLQGILHI